jgi:hypothetical protein
VETVASQPSRHQPAYNIIKHHFGQVKQTCDNLFFFHPSSFAHLFKCTFSQVDLATARPEDLHNRIVHFGDKHVGHRFQEALDDPTYMHELCPTVHVGHRFQEVRRLGA